MNSEQLSLIEDQLLQLAWLLDCGLQPGERGWEGRNTCTIIIFVNKRMHNFAIVFNFAKHFFKSNLYLGCQSIKSDLILKKYIDFYVHRHRVQYAEI